MSNVPRLESHDGDSGHEIILPNRRMPAAYAPARIVAASAPEVDDVAVVMQHLQVLWQHKWALLGGALLGILAGLAVSLWMTPMYMASTTLEIQNVQAPFGPASLIAGGDPALVTQVQLLSSLTMRRRVEEKLRGTRPTELPKVADPLASLRGVLGIADPSKAIDWNSAVSVASAKRRVTFGKDSRILLITSESTHPKAAADFATTLAKEYIVKNEEERLETYQNTGDFLTRAQGELKAKLEDSERQLHDFARASGLVFTGTQNISEEKLKQLQMELAKASVERISKQSVYESSLSSPTESLPEVLDSGPMAQYQVQLADLRRQLAELSTTLTPNHYRTQRVQAQINELEAAQERERKNVISRIRIEFESAQKREAQLDRNFRQQTQFMSGQAEDVIQYNILMREVETSRKLYESTLAQGKEASLASAMRASNARIVDAAVVPIAPISPSLPMNMGLGMVGGLFLSAIVVVARRSVDASIRVPGALGAQLNLRELGVIPSAATDRELRSLTRLLPGVVGRIQGKASGESTNVLTAPGGKKPWQGLELVTWKYKTSVVSEAFRSAMTSILFSAEDANQPQVLVITSPMPQEGKTTVVSNLAIALAEINHRVLIIDADMRLPRLHTIFDLSNTLGLSDFLHERRPIEEYADEELVRKTQIPNLYVMPAGPARSNLSRLLYSARMKELVWRFRGTFDTILIDSAPVLSVPDARILARSGDAVIMVVRANRTHQESALAAVRSFEEDGRRVLGTILNDWNPKLSTYGQYGTYGSAYSRAYGAGTGDSQNSESENHA